MSVESQGPAFTLYPPKIARFKRAVIGWAIARLLVTYPISPAHWTSPKSPLLLIPICLDLPPIMLKVYQL